MERVVACFKGVPSEVQSILELLVELYRFGVIDIWQEASALLQRLLLEGEVVS